MNFSKQSFFSLLLLILIQASNAQDTVSSSWGKRLRFIAEDSTFSLKFGFRFQTLYDGRLNLNTDVYEDAMMVRRSRLKFDGWAIDPSVVYKLELAVSNRDQRSGHNAESGNTANIVLDAVVKWNFAKNWHVWWGQTKLPGNRERVISSQNLQFVDRSLVNSRYNLDRDVGVQLRHKSGDDKFRQILAVSLGQGRNVIARNPDYGYQITGRLEFLPMGGFKGKGDYVGSDIQREATPKLSIGLTGDLNTNAVRSRGNLGGFVENAEGDYISEDLTSFIADMMFKYNGISAMSEFALRSADNEEGLFGTGGGFVFQAGYLFPSNWEIAGRFTDIDADSNQTVFADQREFTLGVSRYISGHDLKFQSDISYQTFPGQTTEYLIFRFQTEIAL
ncbi:Phosphate-selective porin O and P [Ekhidna lutea]|uniref:Phosphate-selective porin O and P n=1 Tax=Ekhidna lutea TaxID=447679 RepID=A0A239KMH2_EKHLU|nr:porin [Ekhidna lutea]SNT19556.1 Phosphate-selective porin O and P [Ekhidna lutea]